MQATFDNTEKQDTKTLSIVIVSYNTLDLIGNCLDSILINDNISREIFVVDNASSDESSDFIKDNFPLQKMLALRQLTIRYYRSVRENISFSSIRIQKQRQILSAKPYRLWMQIPI